MTLDYIVSNQRKFKGLLLDANLLLLLLIGIFDSNQIGVYKKIKKYTQEDFEKLINLISFFNDKIYTTPNILTEITNHTDTYNKETDYHFFKFIESNIRPYNEHLRNSSKIISDNQTSFYKLGLTDASIIDLARSNTLIITDDFPLYHFLFTQNLPAINYTHIQMM